MNRENGHDLIKRILSLEMKLIFFVDIRLPATIFKFDGWANRIVTLTSEYQNIDWVFLSVLTYG